MKKRKIDFIIKDFKDSRLIFRFYPRKSTCHSFNDIPPKSWEEVYKVYYSYSILKQYKFNKEDEWKTIVVFNEHCDECSIIDEIAYVCKELSEGKEYKIITRDEEKIKFEYLNTPKFPFGMGVEWNINKKNDYYEFCLFKYDNIGYRFYLESKKIKEFGEYLENCCEYMLAHGCRI